MLPIFFAGRTDEVGAVELDLARLVRQRMGGEKKGPPPKWKGVTRLFQGAPGAGKTALLERLGENLTFRLPGQRRPQPVQACLIHDEDDLYDGDRFRKKIANDVLRYLSQGSAWGVAGSDSFSCRLSSIKTQLACKQIRRGGAAQPSRTRVDQSFPTKYVEERKRP